MDESQMREELLACMHEQGYSEPFIFDEICFNLHDVMAMEGIIETYFTRKVTK